MSIKQKKQRKKNWPNASTKSSFKISQDINTETCFLGKLIFPSGSEFSSSSCHRIYPILMSVVKKVVNIDLTWDHAANWFRTSLSLPYCWEQVKYLVHFTASSVLLLTCHCIKIYSRDNKDTPSTTHVPFSR